MKRVNSPSKSNTTTSTRRVTKDPARADLVRHEDRGEFLNGCQRRDKRRKMGGTYVLIHVLRDVGHIKICVALVGELLELGVERFLKKIS